MQSQWKPHAISAAALPLQPAYRDARREQQVRTYLLYRSFSTDERNRRGLQWWREARRRLAEQQP